MHAHDHFVRINGLQLHYREWGEPSSPPVVLLHGGSAHAHWWDFFADTVADAYRVLALDLRGHGDSGHPDPPAYRIEDYARDLGGFVDATTDRPIHLIGHSLGGLVATAYAGRAAVQLRSLVIVDTQVRISEAGARYMARLRNFPHPRYRDHAHAIKRFRLLPTATTAAPHVLAHVATHAVVQLADGRWTLKFDRESLAHAEPQDLTAVLQRLTCPILLVRGAHSELLSHAALARLLVAVPHAQGAEIADAHHHVMLDNPDDFARVVRRFLEQSTGKEDAQLEGERTTDSVREP